MRIFGYLAGKKIKGLKKITVCDTIDLIYFLYGKRENFVFK